MTLALELAQALNCLMGGKPCGTCLSCRKIADGKHADVQIIDLASDPKGTNRAQKSASIKSGYTVFIEPATFRGRVKIFIINDAERLSSEAANCLLKTLEEPAEKALYLLLSISERLLPLTLVSRCQRLELAPIPAEKIEKALHDTWHIELPKSRLLSRLSRGCLGWAVIASLDKGILEERSLQIEKMLKVCAATWTSALLMLQALLPSSAATVKLFRKFWGYGWIGGMI